jgi:hypothetical protein
VPDQNGIPVPWADRLRPARRTVFQTLQTAVKLDFDVSDVLTMAGNAVTLSARSPRDQERTRRDNPALTRPAPDREAPDRSVRTSRADGCLPGKRGLTAEMPRGVAPHGR